MYFDNYDDILNVEDLMDLLNIGKHTAYKLLSDGEIKAFKLGSGWRIPKSMVEEYIRRRCDDYVSMNITTGT